MPIGRYEYIEHIVASKVPMVVHLGKVTVTNK